MIFTKLNSWELNLNQTSGKTFVETNYQPMRLFILLLFAISIRVTAQPQDNTSKEMIITPVSVITMENERVLDNQAVIVRNGVISYVGDAKSAKPSKDAIKI